MQAFHNNQSIKEEYLSRVRAHAAADEIIKGQYWDNGRGCAVGCTIHSGRHQDYEDLLGIPAQLAYLEDGLFENLPLEQAKLWPELFLDSINVGADLSLVFSKFAVRILGDSERGCIIHAKTPEVEAAIKSVISLYERKIEGEKVSTEEWELARRTAYATAYAAAAHAARAARADYAAAAYDARAAARAAAARAAYTADAAAAFAASNAAARAASSAASNAAAAYAAARAGADAATADYTTAARVRHYEWMSDILIEELKNASVS